MQSAFSSSIKESKSFSKSEVSPKGMERSESEAEQPSIDVMQGESEQPSSSLLEVHSGYDSDSGVSTSSVEEGKRWYELLEKKIGLNINSRKWIEDHPELACKNKSELIIRLALELCLAKNTEYDPESDSVENEDGKCSTFDTKMIFALFEVVSEVIEKPDRRRFIEFVCQKGNVKLLEMICRQENKGGRAKVNQQYSWKGEFTGYDRLTDLLQYVLKQRCSSEIVLCIAKKVYGYAHILFNGKQYLDDTQVASIKRYSDYSDSVIKDCLKTAIELGYKDVVSVMLGGDIYYCIRLMKGEKFQEEKKVLNMVEETVAEVMSSWVEDKDQRESFKGDVQRLLKEGIEIDIKKLRKQDLIAELESRGIELSGDDKREREILVKKLIKEGGGKIRLSKTVVGSLISALFFNYQNELMKKPFKIEISQPDRSKREKEIDELNKRIDSKSFVKEKVLEKIRLSNKSSHINNSWFFREVLKAIVNNEERLGKLQAVCTAICKEPMQKLLESVRVHKGVVDALKFFGVKVLSFSEITLPQAQYNRSIISSHFSEDVKELVKEKATGVSGEPQIDKESAPAFSKESRNIIIKFKNKKNIKGLTDEEKDNLSNLVSQAMSEIKKGIDLLADKSIDTEDIFELFKVINSEIEKKDKKEIVELVCKSGNVKLLEMICKQENKGVGVKVRIDKKYSWKGEFTGYDRLTYLLQYVLKEKCSSEIVLCIAKKVYGGVHILCNGKQYLDSIQVANIKRYFDYPDSVMEDCLKTAIELGYKDVVQVMLGGDIYHCIRLMKGETFQEEKKVLNMVKETVAEVMSSWVRDERQSFKDDIQRLLKEGIEVDINTMERKDLIAELESRGIEGKNKSNAAKKELVKMLKGKKGGRVRLSKTVVGSLISTLFFNYQNELMKKLFKIEISQSDRSNREKEIDELNKRIDSKSFVKEKVLEKIQLSNKSSHISNDWFLREVLAAIVNDEGRFNKLKAVCAAICKEPMEELLRGAKVHEGVVDVLKFFGVDPLVLEKSNVVANIPLLRISPPDSPSSKAAKKNNKYLMQNNYRRDGEFYYNAGTGSYLNSQNSPRGVRMDSKEKLSQLSLRREDSELILPNLPEIDRATGVHGAGYKQRLLDKVLDYNRIVNHPYLQEGSSEGVSGTLGNSMNQSQQLDFSSLGGKELAAIKAYKDGVGLLKLGREKDGREEFKKAADKGFSHAGYVYAMMIFKEIVQHEMDNESRLPTKKDINKAVQYMINVKKEFFPFPSFVLGVMQSCTSFCKIFANKKLAAQVTSARECFEDILSNSDIGYSEGNYSLTVSRKYIVVEDGSEGYLKWVVQSAKYELARRIFLDEKLSLEELSSAKSLLEELSSDGFVDAEYLYALALLENVFGDEESSKKRRNFNQAYDLLKQAINHEHKEAMFFFGTLPFRQEFKLLDEESQSCKGSHCFGYLEKYIETYGKNGEFKKDAAILIAAEYVKGKGSYVTYDEKEAKDILRENDCLDELQELEKKLQERQKRAKNVLPNVLGALEQVHSELKKNGEQSAQQLSSKVKELLDALRGSSLIIQQSPLLPSTLEQLRISSTLEQRSLLAPLEQLCYVLELQVDSQSHKEVLSPLQSLFSTCIKLQMGHIPSQDLNPNETSTTLRMERSRSISPIPPVSKQVFNPKGSSTMKGDEGVAGNEPSIENDSFFPTAFSSDFSASLPSESISGSNQTPSSELSVTAVNKPEFNKEASAQTR